MNKSNTINSYERKGVLSNDVIPTKTLQDLNMMDSFLFEATTEDMENAKKIAKIILGRNCKGVLAKFQRYFGKTDKLFY